MVAVGDRRGLRWLAAVTAGGGVEQTGVRRCGGRGGSVRSEPPAQGLGASHDVAELGQIPVNHPLQVRVEQVLVHPRRSVHDARESACDNRIRVVTQREPAGAADVGVPGQHGRQRHGRAHQAALVQVHRSHAQRQDPAGAAMGSGRVNRGRRTGQQESPWGRAGIDLSADRSQTMDPGWTASLCGVPRCIACAARPAGRSQSGYGAA